MQDSDGERFSKKLEAVFSECHRVLKDNGLLVFTYHHSRDEGWQALANAVLGARFLVVNCHPVKAEMSVATPKSQAKEPIQLDIIIICRKASDSLKTATIPDAIAAAHGKLARLRPAGLFLSRNDCKIVLFGQLLTTLRSPTEVSEVLERATTEFKEVDATALVVNAPRRQRDGQLMMF